MAKKKKINKKKLLKVIIILSILLIFLILLVLQLLKDRPGDINPKIIPFSAIQFEEQYIGEIPKETFYEKLYIISEYLPKLSKDLKKASNLEKYYKKRKDRLEENLGIEKLSEFKELAEYLKQHDISETEYAYCSYERNSLVTNVYYSDMVMKFVYKNKQELTFKIKLLNKKAANKPMVKVLVNK